MSFNLAPGKRASSSSHSHRPALSGLAYAGVVSVGITAAAGLLTFTLSSTSWLWWIAVGVLAPGIKLAMWTGLSREEPISYAFVLLVDLTMYVIVVWGLRWVSRRARRSTSER